MGTISSVTKFSKATSKGIIIIMQEIFENIAANIHTNSQMIPFIEYCRRVKTITIVGFGDGLSTLCALAAKPDRITVYDHAQVDIGDYQDLANEYGIQFVFINQQILDVETIQETDMLFIDSFQEGNYVFTVCTRFAQFVNRYICANNSYNFAHMPNPQVQLGQGAQAIGIVFGLNSFLQNSDPWHIAENMYWAPGLTILYRKKDLLDAGH